jgi:cytochrome b6-f complex subunit 5
MKPLLRPAAPLQPSGCFPLSLQQLMTGPSRRLKGHGTIVLNHSLGRDQMIEPLLCGIVLGLIPVTLLGLFVAAWNQYRRSSALEG